MIVSYGKIITHAIHKILSTLSQLIPFYFIKKATLKALIDHPES